MKRGVGHYVVVDLGDQREDALEVQTLRPRGHEGGVGDVVLEHTTVVLGYAGEHGCQALPVVGPERPEHDQGVVLEFDDLAK